MKNAFNNLALAVSSIILVALSPLLAQNIAGQLPLLTQVNQYATIGYNDCWGYTAPDGREYALLGVESGTSIIDITDPADPQEIAFVASERSLWKDLKTFQHYAYVVNETGGGVQIIDLADLPNSVRELPPYLGFTDAHNIYIDEETAILYASPGSGNNPCQAISLANPESPVFLSAFGRHNHDVYARGNLVFLSEGYHSTVGIYDLSNPAEPRRIQEIFAPSGGYLHNAWLSDDGQYLMTTEETPRATVKYWNISDLDNISMAGEYLALGQLAHNAHIKGRYAYISHYSDGLRVVDLSDPQNLQEVAFYDTYSGSGGGFVGAWGAFPFFNSGKVLISDVSGGLYVVFFEGAVVTPTAIGEQPAVPEGFTLSQNYPNPFNPSTSIEYHLSESGTVRLTVFNAAGQRVRTLLEGSQGPGDHRAQWNARDDAGNPVESGIYFYRLETNRASKVRKMIYLR